MYENREALTYAKLKDGKVEVYLGKNEDGTKKVATYDSLVAKLTKLDLKEGVFNGEKIMSWQLHLVDDNGERAILSVGYSSGFTRGLLNSLVNADLTKPIRFSCYVRTGEKGDFNCPSVIQDGEVVRWKYDKMPPTEKVKVGSKEVIDDAKAVEWMLGLVKEIQGKLQARDAEKIFSDAAPVEVAKEAKDGEVLNDLPF